MFCRITYPERVGGSGITLSGSDLLEPKELIVISFLIGIRRIPLLWRVSKMVFRNVLEWDFSTELTWSCDALLNGQLAWSCLISYTSQRPAVLSIPFQVGLFYVMLLNSHINYGSASLSAWPIAALSSWEANNSSIAIVNDCLCITCWSYSLWLDTQLHLSYPQFPRLGLIWHISSPARDWGKLIVYSIPRSFNAWKFQQKTDLGHHFASYASLLTWSRTV